MESLIYTDLMSAHHNAGDIPANAGDSALCQGRGAQSNAHQGWVAFRLPAKARLQMESAVTVTAIQF